MATTLSKLHFQNLIEKLFFNRDLIVLLEVFSQYYHLLIVQQFPFIRLQNIPTPFSTTLIISFKNK